MFDMIFRSVADLLLVNPYRAMAIGTSVVSRAAAMERRDRDIDPFKNLLPVADERPLLLALSHEVAWHCPLRRTDSIDANDNPLHDS
jgi:hypothetical protein